MPVATGDGCRAGLPAARRVLALPERSGAARRARAGDLGQVFLVALAGWVGSLRRGTVGRLLLVSTVVIAGASWFTYGAASGGLLTLVWVSFAVLAPAAAAAVLLVWPSAGTAGYVLPGLAGEPAVLAVLGMRRQRDGAWLVENHHARRLGRGWGARLRAEAGPGIARALDEHGAALRLVTPSAPVAEFYRAGFVDGLEQVPTPVRGRWLGRVALERHPRPPAR